LTWFRNVVFDMDLACAPESVPSPSTCDCD
jgi:hypothetical protein